MFQSGVVMVNLGDISIRNKLILLLILPVVALLYFASSTIFDRYKSEVEYNNIHSLIGIGVLVGNYVHESQKERGMTAGYIGTSGNKFAEELPKQSAASDKKIEAYLSEVKQMDRSNYSAKFLGMLDKVNDKLAQREAIRQKVLSAGISASEAIGYYTQLNKASIELIAYMIHLSSDAQLIRGEAAYVNFLQSKERAGIERAILTATFASNKFAPGMDVKFAGLMSAQETYFKVFDSLATEDQRKQLQNILKSPVVAEVNAMRKIALTKIYEGNFGVDSSVWFKTITKKIDLLKEMETTLSNDLDKLSVELKEEAIFDLYLYSIALSLVLLIGLILVLKVSGNILGQLSQLQTAIQKVAETGEFNHFTNINNKDEVGQMANSFDALLHSLSDAIAESNTVITAIANGEFDLRVKVALKGDLKTLKQGINHSAENINETMGQLELAIKALKAGTFGVEVSNDARGRYGEVLNDTKEAMAILNETITDVNTVMSAMDQGQFDQRIQAEASGDLDTMKQRVNNAMTVLESAVQDISRVMVAQTSGDLTQVVSSDYQGDLKVVSEAINESSSKMNSTINQILEVAQSVGGSAGEVSSGSEDLSNRTQQASASIEKTSSSMEEMTSAVKQNSEVSQDANQVAADASSESVKGGEIANRAVEAMSVITGSSQKILDIIGLIDSIAFQTNLLALNAAVEAARAGEHGRGFAVVADEVRVLASSTQKATKQIEETIESLQAASKEAVSAMDQGRKKAHQTEQQANEAGCSLDSIERAVSTIAQMNANIKSASDMQRQQAQLVNSSVENISSVAQNVASGADSTLATSTNVGAIASQLSKLIGQFRT